MAAACVRMPVHSFPRSAGNRCCRYRRCYNGPPVYKYTYSRRRRCYTNTIIRVGEIIMCIICRVVGKNSLPLDPDGGGGGEGVTTTTKK